MHRPKKKKHSSIFRPRRFHEKEKLFSHIRRLKEKKVIENQLCIPISLTLWFKLNRLFDFERVWPFFFGLVQFSVFGVWFWAIHFLTKYIYTHTEFHTRYPTHFFSPFSPTSL